MDKREGPTSHDVVARARRILGTRRVGHTGTLDPFASGLLLLCVGGATRLSQYLTGLDKVYEAAARLGVTTDTLDREGRVESEDDAWRDLDRAAVEAGVRALEGTGPQVPPAFSAKKVGGEAAHRKARRGEAVSLPPVEVTIHEAVLLAWDPPDVRFRVRCSSGTYVRALARDLGEHLGTGAHLTRLRREAIGRFLVEGATGLDGLDEGTVRKALISPAEAVAHLPRVRVGPDAARRLSQGQRIALPGEAPVSELPIAVLVDDHLVAIGVRAGEELQPRKVFV